MGLLPRKKPQYIFSFSGRMPKIFWKKQNPHIIFRCPLEIFFKYGSAWNLLVLVVIDDPIRDLDALSAYQLMTSLQEHAKRHDRIVIVSMRCPRSDIYQLLTQITLLFYGEVMYSGPTKQMPHYFSQMGYRCPSNENPAVYYCKMIPTPIDVLKTSKIFKKKSSLQIKIF